MDRFVLKYKLALEKEAKKIKMGQQVATSDPYSFDLDTVSVLSL